jgi:serine/threonine-protein kinase
MPDLPERLGKYPITGVLGKGAMGIVYLGRDPVIRRPVAIKTIRKELIDDDDNAAHLSSRFRTEAQAAGALSHPSIVSVYEYGEDERFAYIAMEYVEGNSLREYIGRSTRFDEHDIVSIMVQLLEALAYAHAKGVWHRDIKPANIIVMSNGRIKLTDFGIARIESGDRTKTNVIMGTPGYIAPEVYLGEPADHRMDIFSSGVLMYQLLAGQAPFRGRPEAVMHDVCYHDPDPPSQVDSEHRWPQYDALVAHALQKQPAARFGGADAFRTAILAAYKRPLHEAIAESTIIPTTRPLAQPHPEPPGTPSPSRPVGLTASSGPPPTGWNETELGRIEKELAKHVGPVARVLVRRGAREHKQIGPLAQALAAHIDTLPDRAAFVRLVAGHQAPEPARVPAATADTSPSGPASAPSRIGTPVSEQDQALALRLLTVSIGPIARVVVKRAAQALGGDRRAFVDELARNIDAEGARDQFLRDMH